MSSRVGVVDIFFRITLRGMWAARLGLALYKSLVLCHDLCPCRLTWAKTRPFLHLIDTHFLKTNKNNGLLDLLGSATAIRTPRGGNSIPRGWIWAFWLFSMDEVSVYELILTTIHRGVYERSGGGYCRSSYRRREVPKYEIKPYETYIILFLSFIF